MNSETMLLRQVHPTWIQRDRMTSQAFRPTPKDGKKLSVYDGDLISPEKAWEHYTQQLELRSAGVVAVSEGECRGFGLPVISDPEPFPEHVLIDFSGYSEKEIRSKAQSLRAAAERRKWLFQENGG